MKESNKEPLISVTKKDLRRDTYRCSGNGGQNVNKRDTGVRFTHPPSGAVGQSCDTRSQRQNEKLAFQRMANTNQFKNWIKRMSSEKIHDIQTLDQKVDEQLQEKNLKIEIGT